jgi:hypothetical protein
MSTERTCLPPWWEPFDQFGEEVDLTSQPSTPPPDPDKPYLWIGEWVLVVTDAADEAVADAA